MHPRLTALAQADRRVRIVFKDWAIFGEPSVEAARRALAAKYQGKDNALDDARMQIQGKLSSEKIRVAAERAGDDGQRLADETKRSEEHTSDLPPLMLTSYAVRHD